MAKPFLPPIFRKVPVQQRLITAIVDDRGEAVERPVLSEVCPRSRSYRTLAVDAPRACCPIFDTTGMQNRKALLDYVRASTDC